MSNDRILCVRQLATFVTYIVKYVRKLIVDQVELRNVVRIGDWCLFKTLPIASWNSDFSFSSKKLFNSKLIQVCQTGLIKTALFMNVNLELLMWASTALSTALTVNQRNRRKIFFKEQN